jgi:hypothetical protein
LNSTVSTVKKSQARMVRAWVVRNWVQVGPDRLHAGMKAIGKQCRAGLMMRWSFAHGAMPLALGLWRGFAE